MSTNFSPTVQADRAERRAAFAAFIAPYIAARGGPAKVAELLQLRTESSVNKWLEAKAIPRTERLLEIAKLFDIDPHVLLDVAGKPPIVELRHAIASGHDDTLPGMLKEFQDRTGMDNTAASEHFGTDRFTYARFACGSARPTTMDRVDKLARGLGVTITEIFDAAAIGPHDELRKEYAQGSTGAAGMIRETLEAAGIRSWSPEAARQGGKLLAIPVARMKRYLSGDSDPDLLDCQRIARAGVHTLSELLAASGFGPEEALRLAAAVDDVNAARDERPWALHRDDYLSVGELLRAYRITANLSQQELAGTVGYRHHSAVTRIETGESKPSLGALMKLADAVGAPLGRVLYTAGMIA